MHGHRDEPIGSSASRLVERAKALILAAPSSERTSESRAILAEAYELERPERDEALVGIRRAQLDGALHRAMPANGDAIARFRCALGAALAAKGLVAEAVEEFQGGWDRVAHHADVEAELTELSAALCEARRWDEAQPWCERLVELVDELGNERWRVASFLLAQALVESGRTAEARPHLLRLLAARPADASHPFWGEVEALWERAAGGAAGPGRA